MQSNTFRRTAIVAAILTAHVAAFADDTPADAKQPTATTSEAQPVQLSADKLMGVLGLQFWGYMRSGFYGDTKGEPKGQHQLGGQIDHYRLGNEGDTYLEFGIGKKFDLGNGLKWGTYWMPTVYNGNTGTAQIYTDITGLDIAPTASFWAGQRYHRIQDVHILDNWLMQDGDNYGAGVDDLPVGFGTLNVAVHTDQNTGNHNVSTNNAKRINFQWRNMPVNPGGKLTLTGAAIHGNFTYGDAGWALGALHNQDITADINNSLFVQGSNGHADASGEFWHLDNAGAAQSGAKQFRIVDSVNWQVGVVGGQAVVGYQTVKPTVSATIEHDTTDLSLGGRVSVGVARNVKLLAEVGYNNLKTSTQATQHLNKETIAIALSPDVKFWTRPEFRLYVTSANWNDAAGIANAATFGRDGRTNAVSYGAQVEAWWN